MTTLTDKEILSGADNRPPMLEKGMPRKYSELTHAEAIQVDFDVNATNIILQGLPPEVYALERECKLYDEFNKFAYKKGETLRDFYLRFSLLLNDMNIYDGKLEQFQVNTKFLNTLPPEWSKFVTDVKLQGDDPIDAINHMMSFLLAVVMSRYPITNNQLRNLSNLRKQATINDGIVTLQPVQGIFFATGTTRTYTPGASGSNSGKQRTVICYNCKGNSMNSSDPSPSRRLTNPKVSMEKDLFITALKDDIRKLKGKDLADNTIPKHTIASKILKLDVEPIAPKLLNNRTFHFDYLRHTQEQAAILREVVEQGKSQNPLNNSLDHACTVKFGNDHVAKIMGYGDYQIGNFTVSMVYYVEGLGHNLYSVGQFCDSNLEVDFCQHACFALKTKSWLWNQHLSHLKFGAINHLARHGLVRGLPKLNFEKDHPCSACAMGKSKKKPHKPISEDTNQEKLYLLNMDLCGPMRVASVNGKKYILVIVDDYS
nr:hypothetical protein [Tanacetum cinerariifolium]